MNIGTKARLISGGVIGLVGGLWLRHRTLNDIHAGRDLLLAAQSARFDRISAHPPHIVPAVVAGFLIAGALFGLYELIGMMAAKVLATRRGPS